MLLLLTPCWWNVGLQPGRRPITGRIVRWRLQLRPALHPRVTAQIPLSFIASNKGCGSLPLWWSQIRPVQDSTESGTATVAVPDSTRARIRFCYLRSFR